MAEVSRALSLLREELSITDEVLGALDRCQSGTKLDVNARAAVKNALVLLKEKEDKLATAGEALNAHQQLHAEVEALRQELRLGEDHVRECARRLTEADAALRGPLKAAQRLLEAGSRAEAAEIDVEDIVDYAQRISGITSAPTYWKPGMAMVGFAPPGPRPEMMRAGALSAFAVSVGNSLPASELLRIAHDLDNLPYSNGGAVGAAGSGRTSGGDDKSGKSSSSSSSPSQDDARKRGNNDGPAGGEGSSKSKTAKRAAGDGGEDDGGRDDVDDDGGGGGVKGKGKARKSASGARYLRPTPPGRPIISLDLDDLASDDNSSSSEEG